MGDKKFVSTRPNSSRNSCGIGYIICKAKNDAERKAYIKNCRSKSVVTLAFESGGSMENVNVLSHVFNDLVFPKTQDKLGSCVLWNSIPKSNQVIVVGIINRVDELQNFTEDSFVISRKFSDGVLGANGINNYLEISGNAQSGEINISVSGSKNLGKLKINIANKNKSAELSVNVKGKINLEATDDITLQNNTIVYLTAKEKVILGEGDEPMILGNIFKSLLDDFIDEVSNIKTNTTIGLQPILNIVQVKLLKTRTQAILSKYGFLK